MNEDGYDVRQVAADLYEALRARVAELEAQRDDCDKYLKPDETPRQRMDRDQADVLSLLKLLEREKYKSEAARNDALEEAARVAERETGWLGAPHQSNMDFSPNIGPKIASAIRAMKRGRGT